MPTQPLTLILTADEVALKDRIEFEALKLTGSDHAKDNGELALKLLQSLLKRDAIPSYRWEWFVDPKTNIGGRGKSREEQFEKNGTIGKDIARHPHFLEYLRYFLEGPSLPDLMIQAFATKVEDCGSVTSGDVIPLGTLARKLTRSAGLNRKHSAAEFYKLSRELGLSQSTAFSIRGQVMQA